MIKKKNYFFYLVIIFGLFLHSLSLFLPLYDDAAAMGLVLTGASHSPSSLLINYSHFILGFVFFIITTKAFGINDVAIRLVPLLFNLGSFFILYKITKKIYDSKTARTALLLSLFTFFPFFTGTIVDLDGSLVVFFSLLCFYSLYNYFELRKDKKWFYLFLFFGGILASFKTRNLVLFVSFALLIVYYNNKNIKKSYRYLLYLGLSVLVSLFINLLIIWFVDKSLFFEFLTKIYEHNNPQGTLFYFIKKVFSELFFRNQEASLASNASVLVKGLGKNPLRYTNLLVSLTPLYLILPFFQLLKKSKKDIVCFFWLLPSIFFFVAYPLGVLRVPRYMSIFYPPLVILSSVYILDFFSGKKEVVFRNKQKTKLLLSSLFMVVLFFLVNNNVNEYWYFGSSVGPIIKLFYPLVSFVFFISVIFFLLSFFIKKVVSRRFFIAFLVIVFSFNLFLILVPSLDQTHRNLLNEIVTFSCDNEIKEPIYSWNEDVPFYINKKSLPIIRPEHPFNDKIEARLKNKTKLSYIDLEHEFEPFLAERGGTIILLNYPKDKYLIINFKKYNENCKSIYTKKYKTGSIEFFSC